MTSTRCGSGLRQRFDPNTDTLRGGFDHDTIYGNEPTTTGDASDGADDLIDCAYIASRRDPGPDVGYGNDADDDTVVDCSNRDDL